MDLGQGHGLDDGAMPTADESVTKNLYERLAMVLGQPSAGPFSALEE
jgi:hypothetical protein